MSALNVRALRAGSRPQPYWMDAIARSATTHFTATAFVLFVPAAPVLGSELDLSSDLEEPPEQHCGRPQELIC